MTATPEPFPQGAGEMVERIRRYPWDHTPLGPSAHWPRSLRTAVDLALSSPVATVLLWGPARTQIYNDRWRTLMEGKHPAALGQPTHDCFPEIADTMEPLYQRVEHGEPAILQDALLPVSRGGKLEDAWWNIHYLPVRDERWEVAGILCTIMETTWSVRAERERAAVAQALLANEKRQGFLLALSDALRSLSDPVQLQAAAMRLLAEQFQAVRAAYVDVDPDEDGLSLAARHERSLSPFPARMRLSDFSPDLAGAFRQGKTLACTDIEVEVPLEAHRVSYRAIGVRAWAATPLVKANKLTAIVDVHSTTPREWTAQDLRLLQDAADRTWAAVERAQAESALRHSEQQQLLTLQLVPVLLWWADPAGKRITANYRWRAYTGQKDAQVQDFGWLNAVHPDDLEATRTAFEHAFAHAEPLELQQRIYNAREDSYRWHLVRHVPLRGDDGAVTRWFGAAIDVHELHELQERQRVLVAELQHRTRNLLGVVRLITEKTARSSVDLADFQDRFNDRLDALARIQGLLSRLKDHDRVTFDELLEAELSAMDGSSDRVTLSGPTGVRLRSSTVQILAMALHELATNAVKYGALGQPGARLDIAWAFEPAGQDGQPELHIDWHEKDVIMPTSSPTASHGGQGRELIEHALPYQLNARTRYEIGADGVRCTMTVPVSTAE